MHIFHLKKSLFIESKPQDHRRFKYDGRTEIWMRTSKSVKEMLERIKQEALNPPDLSFSGRDSYFSKGTDSCITWAREHLKSLNINLGQSMFAWIMTPTVTYTNSFLSPNYYRNRPVSIQL